MDLRQYGGATPAKPGKFRLKITETRKFSKFGQKNYKNCTKKTLHCVFLVKLAKLFGGGPAEVVRKWFGSCSEVVRAESGGTEVVRKLFGYCPGGCLKVVRKLFGSCSWWFGVFCLKVLMFAAPKSTFSCETCKLHVAE